MYARLPSLEDGVHAFQMLVIVDLTPSKDVFNIVTSDDAGSFIQKRLIADGIHSLSPSFDEDCIKEITLFTFIHFNNIRLKYMNLR